MRKTQLYFMTGLVLMVGLSGCFSSRSFRAWPAHAAPETPIALIPVNPARAYADLDRVSPKRLCRLGNRVLNTLASTNKNNLVGPRTITKQCGDLAGTPIWDWDFYGLGLPSDPARQAQIESFITKTGCSRIIRTYIKYQVLGESNESYGLAGYGQSTTRWNTIVEMELIDLKTGDWKPQETGSGQGKSTWGIFLLVPFASVQTLGRTVDEAMREALVVLLRYPAPQKKTSRQ